MSLPIKLKLPEHFLEPEVRCGYAVSATQKRIWAIELDLLAEIDRVCTKYGIKYQIFAGTLLGAIRHKGFIPWDDDIDVALTRPEFDKLCTVAAKEFKHPYFFQTALTDRKIYTPYARLRNSCTTGITSRRFVDGYNFGIFVDVLILDGVVENTLARVLKRMILSIATKCCTSHNPIHLARGICKKLTAIILFPIVHMVPYKYWVKFHDWASGAWTDKCKMIGLVSSFSFGEKYKICVDESSNLTRVRFENILVCAPYNYDAILTRIYGDYMTYPPPEERGGWHEGKILFEPDKSYLEYNTKILAHK